MKKVKIMNVYLRCNHGYVAKAWRVPRPFLGSPQVHRSVGKGAGGGWQVLHASRRSPAHFVIDLLIGMATSYTMLP